MCKKKEVKPTYFIKKGQKNPHPTFTGQSADRTNLKRTTTEKYVQECKNARMSAKETNDKK